LDKWSEAPIWEHARYMLIVADMRPVYGEGRLAAAVSDHFRTCLGGNSALVDAMRENVRYRKPGTGFFGNLLKIRYGEHAGGVEIKYALYIPLVNAVRLLTVVHGIEAISTIERIRQLEGAGILPRPFASLVLQRFAETIGLRAMIAADEWDRRLESSGIVKADRLTKRLQSQVKGCFSTAKKLHQFAQAQVKQMKQDDFP
jgi:CBS domain-containing protein